VLSLCQYNCPHIQGPPSLNEAQAAITLMRSRRSVIELARAPASSTHSRRRPWCTPARVHNEHLVRAMRAGPEQRQRCR